MGYKNRNKTIHHCKSLNILFIESDSKGVFLEFYFLMLIVNMKGRSHFV